MFVIKYKKFFITLSVLFVALSLTFLAIFGLPLGIDFKGGSELQLSYSITRPDSVERMTKLTNAGFGDARVQSIGEKGLLVKSRDLNDIERGQMIDILTDNGALAATEDSFTTVGPSVGAELKHKAIISIIFVLIAIICFVAYAFSKVSKPVSSWKYGIAVIIALIHDITIPLGAFALLAHYTGAELDTLFVVALLTTLALSVSDTIVVFDRIREHLKNGKGTQTFEKVVGDSLSETFARSINTSLVVLVMVITLAVVGPKSTQLFAIVLAIGMFFGTYSSIFLASPLLVIMEKAQSKIKK